MDFSFVGLLALCHFGAPLYSRTDNIVTYAGYIMGVLSLKMAATDRPLWTSGIDITLV